MKSRGSRGSERGDRFQSLRGCLIMVVHIRSFAVAVNVINLTTSPNRELPVPLAHSMCAFWVRECCTQARIVETLWAILIAASSTGNGVITTTGLTSKSTPTKMIPIPHPQDRALRQRWSPVGAKPIRRCRLSELHEAYRSRRTGHIHEIECGRRNRASLVG